MMSKPDTNRIGLVRGYVVYATRDAGCIGLDVAKNEERFNVNVAYTFWHRHDDDPKIVEQELSRLFRCVEQFNDFSAGMLGYEYKDYKTT